MSDGEEGLTYEQYREVAEALGQLCIFWSSVDRELNALIAVLLRITEEQAACLATEMGDVAPRCRLVKTLSYTIEVPQDWRKNLGELCNVISNHVAPLRNRFIHDHYLETLASFSKVDRRVKIARGQSFQGPSLARDLTTTVTAKDLDQATFKALASAMRLATARFDIEHLIETGRFPGQPALELQRIQQIAEFQLQPDYLERASRHVSSRE